MKIAGLNGFLQKQKMYLTQSAKGPQECNWVKQRTNTPDSRRPAVEWVAGDKEKEKLSKRNPNAQTQIFQQPPTNSFKIPRTK